MRWFKHMADSRHSPELRAATKKLGEVAYGRAFKLFEIVAQRGGKTDSFDPFIDLDDSCTNLSWLADELGISKNETRKTLKTFASLRIIDPDSWITNRIAIPQMKECLDEWTSRRLRASSRVNPENLPSDSGQRESQSNNESSVETGKKRGKYPVRDILPPQTGVSRPGKNQDQNLPASPPAEDPRHAECVEFAHKTFEQKHSQKPTWIGRDYKALAELLKHSSVTTLDFRRRWQNYLASSESFTVKQGHSLAYFCSKFDAFLEGPIHDRSFNNGANQRRNQGAGAVPHDPTKKYKQPTVFNV